jgi:hypothetical protein
MTISPDSAGIAHEEAGASHYGPRRSGATNSRSSTCLRSRDFVRAMGPTVSDKEVMSRRARQRAEEARKRADELNQLYRWLINHRGATAEQRQHARRAAIAARRNADQAHRYLLEQIDRSAAIHQIAAHAHDQAAAAARDHADKLAHTHAAERHRAAALRDRTAAAQLRERASSQ